MATYCGYTESQMLTVLNLRCDTVRLEKVDRDEPWRLTVSFEGRETSVEGTLFSSLIQAFRPHHEWADQRREGLRTALDEFCKGISGVSQEPN